MSDLMHEWLVRGIAAAKTGKSSDKKAARTCLTHVIGANGAHPKQKACAWLWLSEIEDDPAHKQQCLEKVLALEPNNSLARHGLTLLDGQANEAITPAPPKPKVKPAPASKTPVVRRYVCPKCGGKMTFNASRHFLVCAYCDNHFSEPEAIQQGAQASVQEQNFLATLPTVKAQHWQLATARIINCQGCGATFTLPLLEITGDCPFCGSAHVIETAPCDDLIEPGGILAFQFDADIATRHIRAWLARQHFRPERSGQPITISRPRGIYLPFWTFDIGGGLSWEIYLSDQIEWLSRNYPVYADDLLVAASHSLPLGLMNKVSDYDTQKLVPYTSDLLAGWPTEIYQISLAAASLVARQQVVTEARRHALNQMGWETLLHAPQIDSTGVLVESYKLVLLPVWIASYRFQHQRYRLLINGQTGNVAGEKPLNGVQKLLAGLSGSQDQA